MAEQICHLYGGSMGKSFGSFDSVPTVFFFFQFLPFYLKLSLSSWVWFPRPRLLWFQWRDWSLVCPWRGCLWKSCWEQLRKLILWETPIFVGKTMLEKEAGVCSQSALVRAWKQEGGENAEVLFCLPHSLWVLPLVSNEPTLETVVKPLFFSQGFLFYFPFFNNYHQFRVSHTLTWITTCSSENSLAITLAMDWAAWLRACFGHLTHLFFLIFWPVFVISLAWLWTCMKCSMWFCSGASS